MNTSIENSVQQYLMPRSVDQALDMAQQARSNFKYIAGGTDLMVNRYQGNENAPCLIDLSRIGELHEIEIGDTQLRIGAMVTLAELEQNSIILNEFPVLAEAANAVGSPLIRHSATLGGNLLCENRCTFYNQSEFWRSAIGFCLKCEGQTCIATGGTKACFSKFASDIAPVLISMDAHITLQDNGKQKTLPLQSIYSGDGAKPIVLPPMAIITSVNLPLNRQFKTVFKKLRPRQSMDFTSLTTAVTIDRNHHLKIAISGIDPMPVVVEGDSSSNIETLIAKAYKKARAVDNDHYSRSYRKQMLKVFLRESIDQLL